MLQKPKRIQILQSGYLRTTATGVVTTLATKTVPNTRNYVQPILKT